MNNTTATAQTTSNIRIDGTEYLVQGPLPSGAYLLTGPRGGELLAVPFVNDRTMLQVRRITRTYSYKPMFDSRGKAVILSAADLA